MPWGVDVRLHPTDRCIRWSLTEGAVATSSSTRRVWDTTAGPAHHVLDPRTGAPAPTPPVLVSVHAGAAWWAEASATALMLLDRAERARWATDAGVAAVVVEADGTVLELGDVAGRLA
jgi:thiamine biosynthesis lipoprotein